METAEALSRYCEAKGVSTSSFAIAWCLANSERHVRHSGPRTWEQYEDNLRCLDYRVTADDELYVDALVPPGEHSGKGFQDSAYPITGVASMIQWLRSTACVVVVANAGRFQRGFGEDAVDRLTPERLAATRGDRAVAGERRACESPRPERRAGQLACAFGVLP